MNKFELIATDSDTKARAGVLQTDHGEIETPIFMPVGTQGTVKAIEQRELTEIGAQVILGNTYHLYLRPGEEVLGQFGGLHKFMNWDKPILTDSGGYQVFSLKELRKITENGVLFSSHLDGSKHTFTPERVIEIQRCIGSDIIMPLDECAPHPCTYEYAKNSMELTLRWAMRNKEAFDTSLPRYGHEQILFAIGQGSVYKDLRTECLARIVEMDFDGYAIGGLAVGEEAEIMYDIVNHSTEIMPKNKPRYLMGVGTPENIVTAIGLGVDMFDCVMPTRNARNGTLFTTKGKINIRNAKYKFNNELIDSEVNSYASQNFSLGYLRHLFMAKEILGLQLATQHNLAFYLWLVKTAREKILLGQYRQWARNFIDNYTAKGF
ncbi:MAG: tRNA guanosine(34) transglycosylase Tgt [Ignavibacteria bacterium]|nr:tRNA guanosine(34) transglycosylase Tgt [Ignavibacteria bacterium]